MRMHVKILNGHETVMCVDEAAQRLKGLGLKFTGINAVLSMPYEVAFPFEAGARSADDSMILGVKGTYPALRQLEKLML